MNQIVYIKDKRNFIENYDLFAQKVFYQEHDDKVHIKIIAPCFVEEIKKELLKIKD